MCTNYGIVPFHASKVQNQLIMRKYSIIISMLLCIGLAKAQNSINVQFDKNSSILGQAQKQELTSWLDDIGLQNIESLTISGHTDSDGADQYNQWLSDLRVASVKRFLDEQNTQYRGLAMLPQGESNPIAQNDNEQGMAQNRRVEVEVVLTSPSFREINDILGPKAQQFAGNSNEPISIKGAGNTEVSIPANSLVYPSGDLVNGMVTLELTEYLNTEDFLFAGLHTQSGDRLLETGGTIFIKATQNGEELSHGTDKTMDILFDSREDGDGMELFYGDVDDNGNLDWSKQTSNDEATVIAWDITNSEEGIVIVNGVAMEYVKELFGGLDSITMAEYQEQSKMTNLMMSSSRLGWINCDRFLPVEQNAQLLVNIDTAYHASVFLVFEDINSVMNGWYQNGKVSFDRIPAGKKVKVIALSYVNDQPYYAVHMTKTETLKELDLAMVAIGEDELKSKMKSLVR